MCVCERERDCQTSVLILSLFRDGVKGWIAGFLFIDCLGLVDVDEMEAELVMWPTCLSLIPPIFEESLQQPQCQE